MSFNIIDGLIILTVLLGALVGFRRGFTKELVSFIGFILVVFLSFVFKNSVSVFFYEHLPFFKFGGVFKGITALNILVYEVLAFLVVFFVLMIIQKVLLTATGILEKIFDLTVVLGIFSKLLGAIVGAIEFVVIVFLALFILSFPAFKVRFIEGSKFRTPILEHTPILSGMADNTMKVFDEFVLLRDEYLEGGTSALQFNYDALDLFLKYKIISVENTEKLVQDDKLSIERVDELLNKYRKAA